MLRDLRSSGILSRMISQTIADLKSTPRLTIRSFFRTVLYCPRIQPWKASKVLWGGKRGRRTCVRPTLHNCLRQDMSFSQRPDNEWDRPECVAGVVWVVSMFRRKVMPYLQGSSSPDFTVLPRTSLHYRCHDVYSNIRYHTYTIIFQQQYAKPAV
jgi:hypothetical protein